MNFEQNKRNGTIELLRFLSALGIASLHFWSLNAGDNDYFFMHGALCVEFFFLISGFFMASHAMKRSRDQEMLCIGDETWSYVLSRIKSIYFPFIITWIFAFVLNELTGEGEPTIKTVIMDFLKGVPELFLLKMFGFLGNYLIGPMWYISALLISSILLYPLLLKYKRNYVFTAAPLISLFILGYLDHEYGTIGNTAVFLTYAYKCMIRGFADINLGIFLFGAAEKVKEAKVNSVILSLMEITGYTAFLVYIITPIHQNLDFVIVILLSAAIVCTFGNERSWLNWCTEKISGVAAWLGKVSLYVFISHYPIVKIIFGKILLGKGYLKTALFPWYLVTVIAAGIGLMYLSRLARRKHKRTFLVQHLKMW